MSQKLIFSIYKFLEYLCGIVDYDTNMMSYNFTDDAGFISKIMWFIDYNNC